MTTETVEDVSALTWDTLEEQTMGADWREALAPEFSKAYFKTLKSFLKVEAKSNKIFPPMKDIYSWSRLTPLNEVKVVILGQDPYHDDGQAHGLAFSVLPPTKTPPSLRNIYKQLAADIPGFKIPKSGDLSPLARQGVLWLNTALTVKAHAANSHQKKGWLNLTTAALRAVTSRPSKGVVVMAWGKNAQALCSGVDDKKNLILQSAHPSPLSASRGFLGNEHFKKANEWLRETYGEDGGVDWTVLN
ncbi:uracil-DNA glycosylase [Exidia glandulosa HHB12029]|uniref:Uracil-DNA glycosylase n=1 Tax=Exidia glandulosa HHB12029 TaxID=1314781 RepID=A0A166B992_EXIGL|nr:uracil-DNA glycosylase [Exidia glandulosa HHB12029]